jgi:hypothetical protein
MYFTVQKSPRDQSRSRKKPQASVWRLNSPMQNRAPGGLGTGQHDAGGQLGAESACAATAALCGRFMAGRYSASAAAASDTARRAFIQRKRGFHACLLCGLYGLYGLQYGQHGKRNIVHFDEQVFT